MWFFFIFQIDSMSWLFLFCLSKIFRSVVILKRIYLYSSATTSLQVLFKCPTFIHSIFSSRKKGIRWNNEDGCIKNFNRVGPKWCQLINGWALDWLISFKCHRRRPQNSWCWSLPHSTIHYTTHKAFK